jgi:hypothetical protein
MDHSDEKPVATPPIEPVVHVTRLSKQQARFRLWQGQAKRASTSKGGVGQPKRRQPSMPPTPWDNDK